MRVYQLAFDWLAMEIFDESKNSRPKKSIHSQIVDPARVSRSVPGNIGKGYRKKRYPKMFVGKMADADGEATETQVWLDFAYECGYLSQHRQLELRKGYEEVGRMLGGMIAHPERFSNWQLTPQGDASPPAPASCSCLFLLTRRGRRSFSPSTRLLSPPRCRCERR